MGHDKKTAMAGQSCASSVPGQRRDRSGGDSRSGARSLSLTPRAALASRAPARGDAVPCASSFFVPLTPARWAAHKLAGHWRRAIGSGGAVLGRTGQNQRQNQQHIENARDLPRFSGFSVNASRDACAWPCVHMRAYVREGFAGTQEPSSIIYVNQWDSGSKAGSLRFSLEPAGAASGRNGGFLRFLNKIGGGYCACIDRGTARGLICPPMRGRVAQSFGVFGRAASIRGRSASIGRRAVRIEQLGGAVAACSSWSIGLVEGVDQARGADRAGMADFCGFWGVALGLLEGSCWKGGRNRAEMRAFRASVFSPCGLRGGRVGAAGACPGLVEAGGRSAPATPPMPPSRARAFPSSLADAIFPLGIDLSPDPLSGIPCQPAGNGEMGWRKTGSGEVAKADRRPWRGWRAGLGSGAAGKLRRCGDASREARDVNALW